MGARRTITATLVAAALAVATAAGAPAVQTASSAVTVFASATEEPVGDQSVAVTADGHAYAAFTVDGPAGSDKRVLLASRTRTGPWTVVEVGNGNVGAPDVAADDAGNVVVVWEQYVFGTPSRSEIWCRRTTGDLLDQGTGPITGIGHFATQPQVVIDAAGRATVVWLDDAANPDTGDFDLVPDLRARTAPVSDPSGDPDDVDVCDATPGSVVSAGEGDGYLSSAYPPFLAVDGMGNVAAAWREEDFSGPSPVFTIGTGRSAAGTGTWSTSPLISSISPETVAVLDLALGDAGPSTPGDTTVGWISSTAGGTAAKVTTTLGSGPDAGSSATTTMNPTGNAGDLSLTATTTGGTVAAFTSRASLTYALQVRERAAGASTWGAAEGLSASGVDARYVDITADDLGGLTAVWLTGSGSNAMLSRHRAPGAATWDSAVAVPDHGSADYLVSGVDGAGIVTVVWVDYTTPEMGSATLGPPLPKASITKPTATYSRTKSLSVGWKATGASGATTYDVRYRKASPSTSLGSSVLWKSGTSATSATYTAAAGTVCFSVRAKASGLTGPWSAERCTAVPVDDRSLTASSGWTKGTASGWFAATYRASSTKGAALSLSSVKGRSFALLVGKGPGYGKVTVYLGTTALGTWSLAAATSQRSVVIPIKTFSTTKTGKLRVVVATSGKRVVVDGVFVKS